ncbi:PRD domain-containing protein [Alkalihalobacillus sp. MEB130]|uniref:BglG family transcription antiterminator LicT n=1 Tax=Alkalihalobacillus sp. MEB130 TaxID=2976704 RepID=UPI0028DFDF0D|nr:PRD domain-containing protein [Alkalihalobacillus sp. MEB130]MDT8862867.1 PRD domain-containing protein [Alkalihalobacillus sp. MEB130]
MVIKKVINNNIAISTDSQGDEIILIGKGLAFNKKKGDDVDKQKVEKRFYLEDQGLYAKFKKLLQEISIEELNIADDIVSLAKRKLEKDLNESIYISLPDHINLAVTRNREGLNVKNGLLWEIKKLYKEEYLVAKEAVQMINERFNVELGEDEAGFIAFHFVNAQLNSGMNTVAKITKFINEILNIVTYQLNITIDEDSLNGFRFITHLKFFANRIFSQEINESSDDPFLYEVVKERYSKAFDITQKVKEHIRNQYSYKVSDMEATYLTIHIQRLLERKN